MNSTAARSAQKGLTLLEVLVIVAVVAILFVVVLAGLDGRPTPARWTQCVNNLKQCDLAFRVWEGDQMVGFPMEVPTSRGGTKEFITGADSFRHFQVMSNELSTPKILVCPADTRTAAANFFQLKNQNVSYFVGLDANEAHPQMLLSGDRNITGPTEPENGILRLRPGNKASWTAEVHVNRGNIALVDGSVQHSSNTGLQKALQDFGDATNVWRLALPE